MKVLYFFDILEGNFMKYYIKLKKKEVEGKISSLRQRYKEIKISAYCLNKEKFFLSSKNFNESINSVLNEFLHIERNTYNNLVNSVWSNVKKSFENLTKNRLNVLNNFWSIMEFKITKEFLFAFEKFEFIKSIIIRESPDIIFISQKDRYFYKFLKKELNLTNIKFLFLKSQINYFYNKIKNLSSRIYELLKDFKNTLSIEFRSRKRRKSKPDDECYIGISSPGNNGYISDFKSVTDQLERENIKYLYIRGIYDIVPTFRNMKFKWALFCHLKLHFKQFFKNPNNKNKIIRYVKPLLKDYVYILLKDIFFNEIIRIIYIIINFRKELEFFNYKVIIIFNEFGLEGKIAYYISNKLGIPVYFIPDYGIPRRESDVTPYLSDVITVEGKIDKEYLVSKGVDSGKIKIRGSPKYESIIRKTLHPLNQLKDHFTNKIQKVSPERRKIVLATNIFMNESNRIVVTKVVNAVKNLKDIQFIVKLHPSQSGKFIRKVLKDLNYDTIIVKNVDINEIIKTADIFLTQESSVILNSMVVGTPLICLEFLNKRVYFSTKHVYNDDKYIIRVHDEDQLYYHLNELLSSQKKLDDYKNSIKKNLKDILFHERNYSPSNQIMLDLKEFL